MNNNEQPMLAKTAIMFGIMGFIAGILLAPKSGRESRRDLADKSDEIKSRLSSAAKQMKEKSSNRANEVKSNVNKTTDKLKDAVNEAVVDAKSTARKAKSDVKDVVDNSFNGTTM